ncbi:MAG: hypothetical protein Tsb0013_07400 [Phycisphaerales bacterium]
MVAWLNKTMAGSNHVMKSNAFHSTAMGFVRRLQIPEITAKVFANISNNKATGPGRDTDVEIAA